MEEQVGGMTDYQFDAFMKLIIFQLKRMCKKNNAEDLKEDLSNLIDDLKESIK